MRSFNVTVFVRVIVNNVNVNSLNVILMFVIVSSVSLCFSQTEIVAESCNFILSAGRTETGLRRTAPTPGTRGIPRNDAGGSAPTEQPGISTTLLPGAP